MTDQPKDNARRTSASRVSQNHAAVVVDQLDHKIIRILQRNGRTPNTDIARELVVSETTIRNRVARLLEDGLIDIVAVPTPKAVGMTLSAIIGVSVDLKDLERIAHELTSCPEVRYVGLSTGRFDVMIEAFFQDQEHLLDFITRRIGSFQGVRDVESSLILRVVKFSYEWEIPI